MGRQTSSVTHVTDSQSVDKRESASMNSQRAMRRILSLILALSVGLWAQCGLAMLSAASHAPQCHAAMSHAHHMMAAMPCCPSHAASPIAHLFDPPCCDMSGQPARSSASAVTPGKFRSGQFDAIRATGAMLATPQRSSLFLRISDSPPFIKPVFDLKTDLRI
jgi:hypothetical protein